MREELILRILGALLHVVEDVCSRNRIGMGFFDSLNAVLPIPNAAGSNPRDIPRFCNVPNEFEVIAVSRSVLIDRGEEYFPYPPFFRLLRPINRGNSHSFPATINEDFVTSIHSLRIDRKNKALFTKTFRPIADECFIPECSGVHDHLVRPFRKQTAHLFDGIHPTADGKRNEASGRELHEIAVELLALVRLSRDIEDDDFIDGPCIEEVNRGVRIPNRVRMFETFTLHEHSIPPEETRDEALLKHLC